MIRIFGDPWDGVVFTVSYYPPAPTVWLSIWLPHEGRTILREGAKRDYQKWITYGTPGLPGTIDRRRASMFRLWLWNVLRNLEEAAR